MRHAGHVVYSAWVGGGRARGGGAIKLFRTTPETMDWNIEDFIASGASPRGDVCDVSDALFRAAMPVRAAPHFDAEIVVGASGVVACCVASCVLISICILLQN